MKPTMSHCHISESLIIQMFMFDNKLKWIKDGKAPKWNEQRVHFTKWKEIWYVFACQPFNQLTISFVGELVIRYSEKKNPHNLLREIRSEKNYSEKLFPIVCCWLHLYNFHLIASICSVELEGLSGKTIFILCRRSNKGKG